MPIRLRRLAGGSSVRAAAIAAACGAVLAAVALSSVTALFGPAAAVLVGVPVCLGAWFVASEGLATKAKGKRTTGRTDCGCGSDGKPYVEQEYVDVELAARERLVGWGCAGVAVASLVVSVAVVVL
jgi:hypothetical protein